MDRTGQAGRLRPGRRRGVSGCARLLLLAACGLGLWFASSSSPVALAAGGGGQVEQAQLPPMLEDMLPSQSGSDWLRPEQLTRGPETRRAFREVVKAARASTVRVLCDGEDAALGTAIEDGGYVLTKASELRGRIVCRSAGGEEREAELVGVAKPHDLALLKLEPLPGVKGASWGDAREAAVGEWLATPGLQIDPIGVGVVSVQRRAIPARNGVLGIRMGDATEEGVKIAQVFPDSGAAKAGLQVDDVITHVNGRVVNSMRELGAEIRRHRPGDVVHLTYLRDGEKLTVGAVLSRSVAGIAMSRRDLMNRMGGELSRRASGFPAVIQHDTVLAPSDCGGPVVNLEGEVIGINIARAGRTESYLLPADVIASLLEDLKSGKLKAEVGEEDGEGEGEEEAMEEEGVSGEGEEEE